MAAAQHLLRCGNNELAGQQQLLLAESLCDPCRSDLLLLLLLGTEMTTFPACVLCTSWTRIFTKQFCSKAHMQRMQSSMQSATYIRSSCCNCGAQAKLTVLLTEAEDGHPDVWVHAEALPAPPPPPVKLQIR
jgi:hypothetical protein